MSDPSSFKSIPDPLLPEHQLLKEAGVLPRLSPQLRTRVVTEIHKQVRYGRWMHRVRILATTAAALLLVVGIWSFPRTAAERTLESQSPQTTGQSLDELRRSVAPSGSSMHAATPEIPIELRDPSKASGGGGSRPLRQNLNELQQINRLIEHYQQRKTALCSLLLLH
ncbi:MAG: hypothetical protein ACK58L_17695 [Planctomycetota bacterium]